MALYLQATLVLAFGTAASAVSGSLQDTSLFLVSGECVQCHRSDGRALTDNQGESVAMPDDWGSTMMANALRDPFFQATVEREVSLRPALASTIEDICLTCHSPMARTQAIYDGAEAYSLEEARGSALAADGVSCTLCHQIQPDYLGAPDSWNGGYHIDDQRVLFGPYANVRDSLMEGTVNYSGEYGAHMNDAALCATCHTLFTPTLDDDGNIVGSFPEQTAYLEWSNSVYAEEPVPTPCQTCHMPRTEEGILISVVPANLPPRAPFWKHHFVGGNVFLLEILDANRDALGVTASPEQFQKTLERTRAQLAAAAEINIASVTRGDEATTVVVAVTNHAGHKFPTGFPSRRAWLHLRALDGTGQVVFESGDWDSSGEIIGLDEEYEPHHDVVAHPDDVQIYEGVMSDVHHQVTYVLLNAAEHPKDNRLPPRGFDALSGPYLEFTAPHGNAETDPNFNRDANGEGTGSDLVAFRIPTTGARGTLTVEVELVYQSLSPRFADRLFESDQSAVVSFQGYYDGQPNTPVVVARATQLVGQVRESLWMIR